ncbi:hypothetical protein M0802_009724 [Mischocyttarus mexicanus]|nr:hypothetical protein M0802_009724 [Mischocyttarus mexicanus]
MYCQANIVNALVPGTCWLHERPPTSSQDSVIDVSPATSESISVQASAAYRQSKRCYAHAMEADRRVPLVKRKGQREREEDYNNVETRAAGKEPIYVPDVWFPISRLTCNVCLPYGLIRPETHYKDPLIASSKIRIPCILFLWNTKQLLVDHCEWSFEANCIPLFVFHEYQQPTEGSVHLRRTLIKGSPRLSRKEKEKEQTSPRNYVEIIN